MTGTTLNALASIIFWIGIPVAIIGVALAAYGYYLYCPTNTFCDLQTQRGYVALGVSVFIIGVIMAGLGRWVSTSRVPKDPRLL